MGAENPDVTGKIALSGQHSSEPIDELGPHVYPRFGNLRHLRLQHSHTREAELASIISAYPALESLFVQVELAEEVDIESLFDKDCGPSWKNHDLYASTKPKPLNEALLNVSATLSSPDLPSPSNGHILSCAANHSLRLTCLPKLDRLRHLGVDFRGLFGSLPHLSRAHEKDLPALMPPNLKSLMLVCDMGGNETSTAGTERDMYEIDLCHVMRSLRAMLPLRNRPVSLHVYGGSKKC